ncbi:REP-associated tyrosine transposase [Fodinibius halophilus]|uniref:Transposase n=1 Tax=Fodinibius halophilus TaxID=1736908 RepID=A0A6M1T8B0_9BACT|nr:transposase [Fodinibius halophilus]NGP90299.1 transposase [Fodinibius halophilus]
MKIFKEVSLYFITSTVTAWYPVFTSDGYFDIVIESLKYCRENKGLKIYAYVIMLNHIHLIVSTDKEDIQELSNTIRDFKRFTSRQLTKCLENDGGKVALDLFKRAAAEDGRDNRYRLWQAGFHPKTILRESFCRQKFDYIHQNPVRKGYVLKPEYWYYSSAGYYGDAVNIPLRVDNIFE